jgi:hypothetical protein
LQEVSTTALLETAIGAAVGDSDDSWCLEEFMIFWPLCSFMLLILETCQTQRNHKDCYSQHSTCWL